MRFVLALMLLLPVRYGQAALHPRAAGIALATGSVLDRMVLVALDWRENGLYPGSRWPFGLTCCHRGGWTPERDARVALRIFRTGLARCRSLEGAFRYYNTGECCTGRRPRGRVAWARRARGIAYGHRLMETLGRLREGETRARRMLLDRVVRSEFPPAPAAPRAEEPDGELQGGEGVREDQVVGGDLEGP